MLYRIISGILILSILITLVTPMPTTHAATALSSMPVGARIMFGGRQFAVVNPGDGTVVSLKSIEEMAFDTDNTQIYNPSDSNNIGYYLNNTYYNTFTAEEKALIKSSTWYRGNETNETGNTPAVPLTNTKIGLLRESEYNSAKATGIFSSTGENSYWWLITPYSGNANVRYVASNGSVSNIDANCAIGVRPAFRILESTNFEYDTNSGMYYYLGILGDDITVSTLNIGNTIMFRGEAWRVVTPSTGLVVTDRIVELRVFDPNNTNVYNPMDSNNIGYYLNNTYYNTFTAGERALIKSSTWYRGNETNETGNTPAVPLTNTKIGLLRESEYNSAKAAGIFPSTGEYSYWWLITPYSGNSIDVRNVFADGSVQHFNAVTATGVRPAFQILESTIVNEVQTGVYAIAPPDTTQPDVTITSSPVSPTNATTVTYTFEFSEDVTGFTVDDIDVTNGTPKGETFTVVDGNTYTIEVDKLVDGEQVVTVNAGICQDAAANLNTEGTITVTMTTLVTSPGYSPGTVASDRKWFKYYLGKDAVSGVTKTMLVAPKDTEGVMQVFSRDDILDPATHRFKVGGIYYIDRYGKIQLY
ncbi:MAG TPA: hypothetical protein DCP90_01145 [Clostridiales bacterium]|nr:MAG: hypothetical protein A2Y22_08095 [Clostridiales bacterium GWD2_32_59]HAN09203.1 hypothetical protein [Clostridiales bacterium]